MMNRMPSKGYGKGFWWRFVVNVEKMKALGDNVL